MNSHSPPISLSLPKYRADVDGLRAVAVVLVLAFHAFPDAIPGGFIGVDVFFVISGFLISMIIIDGVDEGNFSLTNFYARRIKRIFPALLLVLSTSYVVGWGTLFADEFKQLGKHILAGCTFVSNLVLWREAGYFDSSADAKPLLHLWSLGIEEQFYLAYPLLLVLSRKVKINRSAFIAGIGIASFLGNVLTAAPGVVGPFYSPLTRFWELLLGGFLASVPRQRNMVTERSFLDSALIGLTCIITGSLLLDRTSIFPGWHALLPTIGAMLILQAGPTSWLNRKVLANPALVSIGLISYPLYLWHWPLLPFGRILGFDSVRHRLFCVAASFLLATLTYNFIEKPIRFRARSRYIVGVLCLLLSLVAVFGFFTVKTNGFPERPANYRLGINSQELAADMQTYELRGCPEEVNNRALGLEFCKVSKDTPPTFALIGDSHADDKFLGFATEDTTNSWILLSHPTCPPVKGASVTGGEVGCQRKSEGIVTYLTHSPSIHTVVMSFYGHYMLETAVAADHVGTNQGPRVFHIENVSNPGSSKIEAFESGLDNTVGALEEAGKRVVIILDVPELPFSPRDCLRDGRKCVLPKKEVLERQSVMRGMIDNIQGRHPKLLVLDTITLFCGPDVCRYETSGTIMYRDSHHLSPWGGANVARQFLAWIKRR